MIRAIVSHLRSGVVPTVYARAGVDLTLHTYPLEKERLSPADIYIGDALEDLESILERCLLAGSHLTRPWTTGRVSGDILGRILEPK